MEFILPSIIYIGKEKFSRAYFLICKFFKIIFDEMPKENYKDISLFDYFCHIVLRKIL